MSRSKLEDYLSSLQDVTSADKLFETFTKIMNDYGFDKVTYSLVTDHPSLGFSRMHGFANSFPEDWMKFYWEENLMDHDPVPKKQLIDSRPFFWSNLVNSQPLTDKQLDIMNQASDAGLNDGIAIPLYTRGGEVASVAVARTTHSGDNSYEDLAALQMISTYFHESYRGLVKTTKDVTLTRQQSDVLTWASEGKTDADIAQILNMSTATVRYHWGNIFEKLDAYNRVYAITKAIRMRLILPYTASTTPYQVR